MNNFPAMTEEQRQLAGLCKIEINRWQAASESNPNMRYMADLMEIALAALTAEPVAEYNSGSGVLDTPVLDSLGAGVDTDLYTAPPASVLRDTYIEELEQRAEAAEAKLAELEKQEQRQQLIESCQLEIKQNPHSPHAQMAKIALAALTVELFAYSYLYAAYETCDGFTGWSHKFSLEHPPEWMLETGKVKNLRKLYTAPPAPVLRFPDEKHYKESPHGESSLWAMGWNECLAEVKRLNGQPSPPEASNDQ